MNTKHWLIAGGIVVFLAIAGFVFGLYYVTRVTIKEISGESYLPAIFNQPLRTKTDMVIIELPPHNFIKEPLNISEEFHPSDPIMLEIPVGTPLMFTSAYSRYSAVAGNTSYAFVGTIEVNGKSYPVEWLWDNGESDKAVFEKANP